MENNPEKELTELIEYDMTKPITLTGNERFTTANEFLLQLGRLGLSINALRVLLMAFSQCRMDDKEFRALSLTPREYADFAGIDISNVYRDFSELTKNGFKNNGEKKESLIDELTKRRTIKDPDGSVTVFSLFLARYDAPHKEIILKGGKVMERFFLNLDKNFTQSLLKDFQGLGYNSILLWNYYEMLLNSQKPAGKDVFYRNVKIETLKYVTNTEDKYPNNSNFKIKILDTAHEEIRQKVGVKIEICKPYIKEHGVTIGYRLAFSSTENDVVTVSEPKKKKYFEDKELNELFCQYIDYWEESFGRRPVSQTIKNWIVFIKESCGEDTTAAKKAINETIKMGYRKIVDYREYQFDAPQKKNIKVQSGKKKNSFNNFPQREYDWEEIEQKLINRGISDGKYES